MHDDDDDDDDKLQTFTIMALYKSTYLLTYSYSH